MFLTLQEVWRKATLLLNFDSYLHTEASIWLNPKLCVGKSLILWKLWVQRGILVLGDLQYMTGGFLSPMYLNYNFSSQKVNSGGYFIIFYLKFMALQPHLLQP